MILGTQPSDSVYDSVAYDQVKNKLSESQAEAEKLKKSQSVETCIVIGLSFRLRFQLQQSGFHLIVNDGVISGVRRKWKRSDFSDSDSIALMTLLATPIFYFY